MPEHYKHGILNASNINQHNNIKDLAKLFDFEQNRYCSITDLFYDGEEAAFPYDGVRGYYTPKVFHFFNLYMDAMSAYGLLMRLRYQHIQGITGEVLDAEVAQTMENQFSSDSKEVF